MSPSQTSKHPSPAVKSRPGFSHLLVSDKKLLLPLLAILAVTFICYIPALTNEFVNWDDYGYVVDNTLIRDFSVKNIATIFTKLEQMGNYHPLTMLTYNIEYQFFGQNPHGYHVTNIMLHLINTALVFWLLYLLSGRTVAIVVATLFGVHTLHVESVAWVSERKDLLYAMFFFLSLICYVKYVKTRKDTKLYIASFAFFILSVLSKAMGVSLAAVLLLVDYLFDRKFEKKVLIEKVPFFVVALIFGVLALFAQQAARAIHGYTQYSVFEKILFACLGFVTYLFKLIIPTKLSAFYPYPEKVGGALPASVWLYPLLALLIAWATLYSLRNTKKIFFGMMFFVITIALVLQILQVGGAVMADRYTYIPSLGFFFILAEGFEHLREKQSARAVVTGVLVLYIGWLCVLTWEKAGTWRNSFVLWTDVVGTYERIPFAFANRGYSYYKIGKYDEAVADYNRTLALDASDAGTYHNRGVAYYHLGKNAQAITDYNKALELKLDNAEVYNNRGAAYAALGKADSAIGDFTKAISLSPEYAEAYNNRGTEYAKARMFEAAITDFDKAIQLKPDYVDAVRNREMAANDLRSTRATNAQQSMAGAEPSTDPEFYLSRGLQYGRTGNTADAIKDFDRALQLRPTYADAFNNRGIANAMIGNYDASFADFAKAIQTKPDYADAYFNRGIAHRNKGNTKEACADFSKAASMNFEPARKALQEFCR
jgi:tetratricopeptide (TPR) repeat protein